MSESDPSTPEPLPLSGRLPFCEDGPLSEDQSRLARQLHELAVPFAERAGFAGTDDQGRLIGPGNVLVARPAPADGYNQWVLAEQTNSGLDQRVREVVILTVAVARDAPYAVYAHRAAGRLAGLSDAAIEALVGPSEDRSGLSRAERTAHRFADQLARRNCVDDAVYDEALNAFGQDGVLDLTHLVAIYLATCTLLGAFAVPAPNPSDQW